MATKLYVGNLSYNTNDAGLQELFSPFGQVVSASVAIDRMSNRSRGFGFVEMATQEEAEAAIAGVDGHQVDGRSLKVNVAKPREERAPRRY